jgi:hypothetical protein
VELRLAEGVVFEVDGAPLDTGDLHVASWVDGP